MADYGWQEAAVTRFAREKIAAIISGCGTGKTRVGVKLGLAKLLPVIVIVPKNISKEWVSEIRNIAGEDQKIWLYDAPTEHKDPRAYFEAFKEWLKADDEEIANMRRAKDERHAN